MKPMLAATADDVTQLRYPLYASPKLDGVRALVINGQLKSRSLKPIPNAHVSAQLSRPEFNGLDGELIVGEPTAKDVYRVTLSATAREAGKPVVTFYVFDDFTSPTAPFSSRLQALRQRFLDAANGDVNPLIVVLGGRLCNNPEQLLAYEQEMLALGYEGLILRSPNGAYKQGRSTLNEGGMLKLKRFTDSEAVIIGMEEEMANNNAATINALGRTERSTAQAGLSGKGRMGALIVRDCVSGIEFNIGTGFTMADREAFWQHRDHIVKQAMVVKYKSFLIGVKEAPRFPVYLGMRANWDRS